MPLNYDYYTSFPGVWINGTWINQAIPISLSPLINNLSGPQVAANLLNAYNSSSSQVPDPFNQAAIEEKKAYWVRWMSAQWLPVNARANFIDQVRIPFLNIQPAPTTLYLDTNGVPGAFAGPNGPLSAALTVGAQSFYAPGGINGQLNISLPISANTHDANSFSIYLVPDDGSGNAAGTAGKPTSTADGSGNFLAFTNAQLIATIQDNTLPITPDYTLATFSIIPLITTLNDEYWIAIVFEQASSGEIYYSTAIQSHGTSNQAVAYVQYNGPLALLSDLDSGGMFQFIISAQQ